MQSDVQPSINQLLLEADSLPKYNGRLADALVLVHIHCKCLNCGTEYNYPNHSLTIRYGTIYKILGDIPQSDYLALKRETFNTEQHVSFCLSCWKG